MTFTNQPSKNFGALCVNVTLTVAGVTVHLPSWGNSAIGVLAADVIVAEDNHVHNDMFSYSVLIRRRQTNRADL